MGLYGGHVQGATALGVLVNCVVLSTMLAVHSAHSSTAQAIEASDNTYAICASRCVAGSNSDDRQTLEACMLKCRNYIEQAMFRPRVLKPSKFDNEKTMFGTGRYTRASGARNHMFVRVGKSSDSESDSEDEIKRSGSMQMRGSFVRIGRQMSPLSTIDDTGLQADSDAENDDDITKRRTAGFVRIGRRGPSQQFVRIGRDAVVDGLDDGENDDQQEAMDKRAKGQAFVRIGRKAANFVRIGKAFVRIGKNDVSASSATPDAETENVIATSDEA